jgi:hypothetical protein
MLGSWGAAVVAGAGSVTGLVLANHLLPSASLRGDTLAVAMAAWVAAAAACAGTLRLSLRRLPPSALETGTGWVAGALVAAAVLGWGLWPPNHDFRASGPVLAVWLAVGSLTLCVGQGGEARGWWSVPSRMAVGWAVTYGGVWLFVAAMMVSADARTPAGLHLALAIGSLLSVGVVFALVCGGLGPSEPRHQTIASWLTQPLVVITGPGAVDELERWGRGDVGPLGPFLALGSVLTVLSLAASLGAAVVTMWRAGRARRHGAGQAASDSPAR